MEHFLLNICLAGWLFNDIIQDFEAGYKYHEVHMTERSMKYVVRVRIVNSINHLQCQDQVQHLVCDEENKKAKRKRKSAQFVLQYFPILLSLSLLKNTQS